MRKMIQSQGKNHGSLSILHMNSTGLGDSGITQLAKGISKNSQILDLSLADNDITITGIQNLLKYWLNVQSDGPKNIQSVFSKTETSGLNLCEAK